MQKAKKYDWKDSNMALFGSDTEKKVKKESAESEPAWQGAGQEPGLRIWRIVKFKVEHWPKEQYGDFFNGDSYIILNTYKDEEELKHDVHFWIGKYSTQDEYGTAAYKTVELDTFLDDAPIQHREVQGHESKLFQSYFNSMQILKGGAATGFRRVLPTEYTTRLFHCKRNESKKLTSTEVAPKRSKVSSDDVFILDTGSKIYVFCGSQCSNDERFKAAQVAANLKSSRSGASVETLDEDDTPADHPFFTTLKDDSGEEPKEKTEPKGEVKMMKISDADGSLDMEVISEGHISKDALTSEDVFLANTGSHVFVYVGSGASIDERKNGISYASNYLNKTETPWLPISVVVEGKESSAFKAAF